MIFPFISADFGFARFLQDGMMAVTMCGSPMYMAPEVLMCRKYDAVADIWSMGIIVYQCLTGKAPFYANTPEALKNIYEKTACLRPKIPVTTSKALQDLLLKMLIRKPSDRIDFRKCKELFYCFFYYYYYCGVCYLYVCNDNQN
ncbi:unnamed protein product [Schistosoma margrebowiei]|uniref:Uncharacterized protein n=1 Tax=Schistosoma margrebowiei TaxID=48269 RepID=A0A183NB30_9TREM|nr:unnamed protein product [Schistosoma margrebowiei]